jgi:hypothetical protein
MTWEAMGMKLTQEELSHLIFLSGVVKDGNKKGLMAETIACLIYIVKALPEVELPDGVIDEINALIDKVEVDLRQENDRLHEIRDNLSPFNR